MSNKRKSLSSSDAAVPPTFLSLLPEHVRRDLIAPMLVFAVNGELSAIESLHRADTCLRQSCVDMSRSLLRSTNDLDGAHRMAVAHLNEEFKSDWSRAFREASAALMERHVTHSKRARELLHEMVRLRNERRELHESLCGHTTPTYARKALELKALKPPQVPFDRKKLRERK